MLITGKSWSHVCLKSCPYSRFKHFTLGCLLLFRSSSLSWYQITKPFPSEQKRRQTSPAKLCSDIPPKFHKLLCCITPATSLSFPRSTQKAVGLYIITTRGHVQYHVHLIVLKLPPICSLCWHKATFCPPVLPQKILSRLNRSFQTFDP